MQIEFEKATLANLANGAAAEVFQNELQKALDNTADPNTDAKTARVVTLKVTMVPTEDRSRAAVSIAASSKLAPTRRVPHSFDLVQEGRKTVAYQNRGTQGELFRDNVKPLPKAEG